MDASSIDGTHSPPPPPPPKPFSSSSTFLLRTRLFAVLLVLLTAGRGACLVGLDGTVRTRRGRREGALDDVDLDGVGGEAPAARNVTVFLLGGFAAAAHEENKNLPERISSDMLLLLPARPQAAASAAAGRARAVARRRQRWGGGARAAWERANQLTEGPTSGSPLQVNESFVES
jgi:hypothetical protein